jgi:hypothetical protein
MPFMAIYRGNISPEDYARYRAKVPFDTAPQGALTHSAARAEDGSLCVVELWEDLPSLERFTSQVVAPALREVGLPVIAPEVLAVETIVVVGDTDRYRLSQPRLVGEPA